MTRFVDIETPYSAPTHKEVARNVRYARACVRDCLRRDEIPYASHLFYTQSGILDDNVLEERERGILAGKAIIEKLGAVTVVYTDLGMSRGMEFGITLAKENGREVEFRSLGKDWETVFFIHEATHAHNAVWCPPQN